MKQQYKTKRLTLKRLTPEDADFIFELVNTPAWIKYIGDRNIKSKEDAANYIEKILNNPDIIYWVVQLTGGQIAVGIITFIKRDYLAHHDIGFAFLPVYTQKGLAFEAAFTVLNELLKMPAHRHILATTIKENNASVQLLKKMGFAWQQEINSGNDILDVYGITKDKLIIPQ
ncbi:MAG: GNAT family N-acetyltransferase [Chitinophagaceae bacterium]|nr:GNAT family N-acetyltransferase [Chitinophagaceae bacterium]MBK7559634.1 GNAT family N-acetyltransferase [Chitinophagaceae bacterium]MBK9533368.1 GNAT family N-acetyltransferase [Chitinophagaceae bacterium]HQW93551.1 GNAT family N-acetyltransferase [Ferruginibacter sp.]